MKYDIPAALQALTPGAEWVLRGSDYSGLEWIEGNGHDKPTENALNTKISELDGAEAMKLLREERDLPASATPTLDSTYNLDLTSVTWPTEPS